MIIRSRVSSPPPMYMVVPPRVRADAGAVRLAGVAAPVPRDGAVHGVALEPGAGEGIGFAERPVAGRVGPRDVDIADEGIGRWWKVKKCQKRRPSVGDDIDLGVKYGSREFTIVVFDEELD